MSVDRARLAEFSRSLEADDYHLDVELRPEAAEVRVVAGPTACEECLVPKSLMRSMLAPVLGVEPDSIALTYPSDAAGGGEGE